MENSLHQLCVVAVNEMVKEGVERHVSYISDEDGITFSLKPGGKIPKVTIEWVDASEALPPDEARKNARQDVTDDFNKRLTDALEKNS